MKGKNVAVIGGGPAGLLAARLLARGGFDVTLYERLDPTATYGFGVALAGRVGDRLRDDDPVAAERIADLCYPLERWTMRRDGEVASIEDRGAYGVQRTGLLRTLQSLATQAGALVKAGTQAHLAEVVDTSDVVVLADGVGSMGRESLAAEFGATIRTVPIPYIWCGAVADLDGMTLDLRRTEHGIFCAHAMPYGGRDCTFQVDTTQETLERAGFAADVPATESDEDALAYLSGLFGPLLDGVPLIGNRSRWSTFRLVTCERWSAGSVVLVGDAAHTAHYTVGSGTRMAMEDAIVLSQALVGSGSVADAFDAYEADRRPAVEHLQWRAMRSQTWWRTLASRYSLPLDVLLLSYFTRTASVGLEKLASSNPGIVRAAIEHSVRRRPQSQVAMGEAIVQARAGADVSHVDEVLSRRLVRREAIDDHLLEIACDGIAPWSGSAAPLRAEASHGVVLTGSPDRRDVLDRFDIAEELTVDSQAPIAVAVPRALLDDAAAAIAAGRTDYVVLED